jgi:hypothetical protein
MLIPIKKNISKMKAANVKQSEYLKEKETDECILPIQEAIQGTNPAAL